MFRGLIRTARRTAESAAAGESSSDLRQRLAVMSTSEREHELLDIVRSNAAAVLGHDYRRRGGHGPGVQGAGLRFAGRGRVPESAQIGDRLEAAYHRCLRPSDTDGVGPVSGPCARHRRASGLRGRAKRPGNPTSALAVDGLPTRYRRHWCALSGSPNRAGSRLRPTGGHGESGADARVRTANISAKRLAAIAFRASRRRVRPARRYRAARTRIRRLYWRRGSRGSVQTLDRRGE